MINDFLLMLQTLTRIPVKKTLSYEKEDFRRGANYLFLVGLLVGGIQFITYIAFKNLLPVSLLVLIIILEEIIITGALHLDGFADICDGFFAFKGRDRIIEIMKDSRIGAFAGIGIVMNIFFKFYCYVDLLNYYNMGQFIVVIPMIGRVSIVFMSLIGKPAKKEGTGNSFIGNLGLEQLMINLMAAVTISVLILEPLASLVILVSGGMATILFNQMCSSKINGITGDSLGANNEIVTIAVMLSLIIMNRLI